MSLGDKIIYVYIAMVLVICLAVAFIAAIGSKHE
jgi:hypothetical protein